MYKCYTSLAFLLLCSFFAQAQIDWVPLDGPRGISGIQVVACDSTGRLFAFDYPKRFYVSTDNGETWVESTGIPLNNEPRKILVFPSGKVLAQAPARFYRYQATTNSWAVEPLATTSSTTWAFDSMHRLWKADKEGNLSVSMDEGATLQKVLDAAQTDGVYENFAAHNDQHNLIALKYGASSMRVVHFTASAEVKEVLNLAAICPYIGYNPITGTAFASDYKNFLRSTDGGLTWQAIAQKPVSNSNLCIRSMFFESATRIWLAAGDGVFLSEDDGLTWASPPIVPSQYGNNFFLAPNGAMFVSNSCGAHEFSRSLDEGATWTDLSEQFALPILKDIVQDRSGNLFVKKCYESYDRSSDGGKNWQRDLTVPDSVSTPITQVVTHPSGSAFAVANKHIYQSLDGGGHWEQITAPQLPHPPLNTPPTIAMDWNGNLYAFYHYSNSYKSTDMGQTWKAIGFDFDKNYHKNAVVHINGDIYAGNGSASLLHYIANQDTVVHEDIDPGVFAEIRTLHSTSSGELYISTFAEGSGSHLHHLAANGQFERVPFFETRIPDKIASNQYGTVFVTSEYSDTIYQSDNGGLLWTVAGTLPQTQNAFYFTVLDIGIDQHLYLGYQDDVVYRSAQPTAARNLVRGKVWLDKNGNCAQDPDEPGWANLNIKATGSGGAFSGFSGSEGRYKVSVPDGAYALNVVPPNALFAPCLPDVPLNFTGASDTASADLPLKKLADCPYLRVSVATPFLRRCFENTYTVRYCNEGTAPANGAYVEVLLDSLFDFVSATLPVSAQSGQTYTFLLGDVQPGDCGQFYLKIKVSCEAALGQEHCMEAHIYPDLLCLPTLPALALSRECRQNMGAFDPNDKRAFVVGREEPGSVLPNTDIEYIVRFQNTGTDTAFRVVIEDRFTSLLDLNSLRLLAASHPFELEVSELGLARFVFDNIALPDSHINAVGSIGFVKFAVRQMPDLPLGSVIRNQASIFFDFNTPVITNESKLVVTIPVGTTEPDQPYRVSAYPNPFGEAVTFQFSSPDLPDEWGLRIFDALGRLVGNYRCGGRTFTVPRGQMGSGFYHYAISSGSGQRIWSGTLVAGDF